MPTGITEKGSRNSKREAWVGVQVQGNHGWVEAGAVGAKPSKGFSPTPPLPTQRTLAHTATPVCTSSPFPGRSGRGIRSSDMVVIAFGSALQSASLHREDGSISFDFSRIGDR